MTTWREIEAALVERFGATRRWRHGANRGWWVPMPAGRGLLTVEVTLRPRWCSLAIDRWHTTDRDQAVSKPWLEQHVWPAVRSACATRTGVGILPSGSTFASAHPVDRSVLLDVLLPWVEAERSWAGVAITLATPS